jgi:NADP-dependent 3-hydroxy acid dehydrogenase YdfG
MIARVLDVLVNNAGVDVGRRSAATIQGLELRATSAVG